MNEQRKDFLIELAARLADIYEASSPKPANSIAAKLVRQTLAKFGIIDEVSILTRKLKDNGGSISLVKVDNFIIDITCDPSFMETEEEHPLFTNFRGRGRDPIERDPEAEPGVELPLTVVALLRAMMVTQKTTKLGGPESPMVFHLRLKDVRTMLKRQGVAPSYDDMKLFIKEQLSDDITADVIVSGVQCIELMTHRTVNEWTQERLTVAERMEELFNKYVKNVKATG